MTFASEDEIYSGRSDYPFWPVVKEAMEANSLGFSPYELPNFDNDGEIDDFTFNNLKFYP